MKRVLEIYDGRRYWVIHDPENFPKSSVEQFLAKKIDGGELKTPFGPGSLKIRRRIAVLRAVKDGKTIRKICEETKYCERSAYVIKARFKEKGLLPNIKKLEKDPRHDRDPIRP